MLRRRSPLLWLASAGVFVLAACSGTPAATPTPAPTHPSSPTPSPTPLPPDTMTVSVLADGVGTFDLAAFPVASLKNNATYHGAAMVQAHFVTHKAGKNSRVPRVCGREPWTRRDARGQRRLYRRMRRRDERQRHRHGWLVADRRWADLHDSDRRLLMLSMPHRTRVRRRQRNPAAIREPGIRQPARSVRRLPQRRRRDPRRRHRGVRLAVGNDLRGRRPGRHQRSTRVMRAGSVHRLVGRDRSV